VGFSQKNIVNAEMSEGKVVKIDRNQQMMKLLEITDYNHCF